jgi:hypothetical protein
MSVFKIGAKSMSHKVLNTYKSKQAVAWIAVSLSVILVAHSEI